MSSGTNRPLWRYAGAAFLLGALWLLALMIPEATRNVILEQHPVLNALSLCLVSVAIALSCRRLITWAKSGWRFLVVAVCLPFVGASLWFVTVAVLNWSADSNDLSFAELLVVTLGTLPIMLGAVALAAYYVVLPMGLLSQFVMVRLATTNRNRDHVQAAT